MTIEDILQEDFHFDTSEVFQKEKTAYQRHQICLNHWRNQWCEQQFKGLEQSLFNLPACVSFMWHHPLLVSRQHSWHYDSALRLPAAAAGRLCSSRCGRRQRLPRPEQHSHPHHPSVLLRGRRLAAYLLSWGHLPARGPQHWSSHGYSAMCSSADW